MITRITISGTTTLSANLAWPEVRPQPGTIHHYAEAAAKAYGWYRDMLSFVMQFPETKPEVLVNMFIPEAQITTRTVTKKKRTYSVAGITITEEDNL
jgi:hypothetical protein